MGQGAWKTACQLERSGVWELYVKELLVYAIRLWPRESKNKNRRLRRAVLRK